MGEPTISDDLLKEFQRLIWLMPWRDALTAIVAQERERCAQIAESINNDPRHGHIAPYDESTACAWCACLETIAQKIREGK